MIDRYDPAAIVQAQCDRSLPSRSQTQLYIFMHNHTSVCQKFRLEFRRQIFPLAIANASQIILLSCFDRDFLIAILG
jgi:hypothetical protein